MHIPSNGCLAFVLYLIYFCNETWSKNINCGQISKEEDSILDFKSDRKSLKSENSDEDDVTCQVIIKVPKNFYAIRIDFVDVKMDGPSIFGTFQTPGVCDSDMFIFKGFTGWTPPPRCGRLKGYSCMKKRLCSFEQLFTFGENFPVPLLAVLIDRNANLQRNSIKIVALMSSESFKWHIRISQVKRPESIPTLSTGIMLRESLPQILMNQSYSRFPSTKAIKYGSPANKLTAPYLVSIRKISKLKDKIKTSNCSDVIKQWNHKCGGSIIAERIVLTTAECFHHIRKFKWKNRIKDFRVAVGDLNVCRTKAISGNYEPAYNKIKNVVFHYGYDALLQFHDIAIVVLEEPVKFDQHIQPIQLNEVDDSTNKLEGLIAGFGSWDLQTEGYNQIKKVLLRNFTLTKGHYPFDPQVSKISLDPTSSCSFSKKDEMMKNLYGKEPFSELRKYSHVYESIRCGTVSKEEAKNSTRGTKGYPGIGDGGGPFVSFDSQGVPKLTGVILNPKRNPRNQDFKSERLFISVAYYRSWIESVVASYNN